MSRALSSLRRFAAPLVFAAIGSSGMADEPSHFTGAGLPVPPEQSQPWSLTTSKLSTEDLDSVRDVFNEILADPRGCDYREITVVAGTAWDGGAPVKTHGWVLPGASGQRFGICWNGLVYPLLAVGAPADFRADVRAMLTSDQAEIDKQRARFAPMEKQQADAIRRSAKQAGLPAPAIPPLFPLRFGGDYPNEWDGVMLQKLNPVRAALLLRLGEAELGDRAWRQFFDAGRFDAQMSEAAAMRHDCAWSRFDRAVTAHMRGDDHLALIDAQALESMAEAAEKPLDPAVSVAIPHSPGDLSFLDVIPGLLIDEKRRVTEPAYTPILQMPHPPQGAARISGLIRDLELVSARQMGQPGGVNLADDPIVQALIQCGHDAVEPLLDCMDHDDRLTRSVSFGRDFRPERNLLPVHDAAYAAVAAIVGSDFFTADQNGNLGAAYGGAGGGNVESQIRTYWEKYRNVPLEQRWYQTLADDKAPPAQWLEAGGDIVRPVDVTVQRSSMFGEWTSFTDHKPGEVVPMRGESLRAETNPSVSYLLLRRMQDLSAPTGEVYDANLQMKTQFALMLAKWDGRNQLAALRDMTATLKKRIGFEHESRESELTPICWMYKARVACGDPDALAEYAKWVVTVSPDDLNVTTCPLFEIIQQHPREPVIQKAARQLFATDGSPWVPLLREKNNFAGDLYDSPLIGLAGFRDDLLRGLRDKSEIGTATLGDNSYVNFVAKGRWTDVFGSSLLDPLAPPKGSSVAIRACDCYAFKISLLEGTPDFRVYWPVAKRDRAIPGLATFIQRYGDCFQYDPIDENLHDIFNNAHFHLAPLDHPATADDVRGNRAIFSLEGQGEVRQWKMPGFPLKASWKGLKDRPQQGFMVAPDGKQTRVISYDTSGRIFQAEEVLVDGKWQRYFGFVGGHHFARVPASEIELPAENDFLSPPLTHGFESRIEGPGDAQRGWAWTTPKLAADAPLPLVVHVRNRSGLDQIVPANLLQPADNTSALPHSVTVTLEYCKALSAPRESLIPESAWGRIRLKKGVIVDESHFDGVTLNSTDEMTIMTVDLRDLFDVGKPGTYRVQVVFDDPQGPTGKSQAENFTLLPP